MTQWYALNGSFGVGIWLSWSGLYVRICIFLSMKSPFRLVDQLK
jgi:hypothetical protein